MLNSEETSILHASKSIKVIGRKIHQTALVTGNSKTCNKLRQHIIRFLWIHSSWRELAGKHHGGIKGNIYISLISLTSLKHQPDLIVGNLYLWESGKVFVSRSHCTGPQLHFLHENFWQAISRGLQAYVHHQCLWYPRWSENSKASSYFQHSMKLKLLTMAGFVTYLLHNYLDRWSSRVKACYRPMLSNLVTKLVTHFCEILSSLIYILKLSDTSQESHLALYGLVTCANARELLRVSTYL